MDSTQKLISDIEKIKKHYRAQHNGEYDGEKACSQIKELFARSNPTLHSVAQSFAEYWYDTYIANSADIHEEPSQDNISRLAAMQSILDEDTEYTDLLSNDDWQFMCQTVSAEAEDLPIETLNSLMSLFLDKKAF